MAKARNKTPREYKFIIDAYTPETMPMKALSEYLREWATLLGEEKNVHLLKIEKGSTTVVARVDREAEPKVRDRLIAVRNQDGPPEAMRAQEAIDQRLELDNASGYIADPVGEKLIFFPGCERIQALEYGPINQAGTLDGIPVSVVACKKSFQYI